MLGWAAVRPWFERLWGVGKSGGGGGAGGLPFVNSGGSGRDTGGSGGRGTGFRQEADGRYARVEEEEPGRLDDGFVIEDDDEDEQEIGHSAAAASARTNVR